MMKVDADILESLDYPSDDSDGEQDTAQDGKKHKNLLKEISQISGVKTKKLKKASRTEASRELAESNWTSGKDASEKLNLQDLIGSLKSTSAPVAKIKKKLNNAESTKVLKTPLHKPQADRIARGVAYSKSVKDVAKWEPTVIKNRDADQITFPLQEYKPAPVSAKSLIASHRPGNSLEREIAAVLKGSAPLLERKDKELTEAEEKALNSFGLEEAMGRRKELQKARALQSYYEAKCRRVRKIKSKKFHRVARKEQEKLLGKVDLGELARTDPELFQAELQKAEKMRALERANLRHRNTSKWAKNLITRGHKSKDDMDNIREQLRISRALTDHKTVGPDSDKEEEDRAEEEATNEGELNLLHAAAGGDSAADNPWLLGDKNVQQMEQQEKASSLHLTRLQPVTNKDKDEGEEDNVEEEEVSSGEEWEGGDSQAAEPAEKSKKQKKKKKTTAAEKKEKKKASKTKVSAAADVLLTAPPKTQTPAAGTDSDNDMAEDCNIDDNTNEADLLTNKDIDSIVDQPESGDDEANNEPTENKSDQRPTKKAKTKKIKTNADGASKDSTAKSTPRAKKLNKKQKQAAKVAEVARKLGDDGKDERKPGVANDEAENDGDSRAVDFSGIADTMAEAEEAFEEAEAEAQQQMHIREAFASDDVISEFLADKEADIKEGQAKPEDNVLPGWGDWAGGGLKVSKKKKRQFTKKPTQPDAPRKDASLSNVIISEKKNKGLAKIQVASVPFPYTSKEEFERSLRQPIGPHWNTPSAVAKLTEPRIKTTAGQVIDPLKPSQGQKRTWKSGTEHQPRKRSKKKKKSGGGDE